MCLQLGEKQKELDRLQEQNLHLKEQLDEARGREHSAREGYVLQVPIPPPSTHTHTHTHTHQHHQGAHHGFIYITTNDNQHVRMGPRE